MKALAERNETEGCTVTADTQTAGRGRRGKSFYSPKDTGIYMSVLLRPELSVADSLLITPMTAVAAARAIESVCCKKCGIKWVNDIYCDGKKVAGILCEASFDHPRDKVNYVIAGIGVNLATPEGGFPEELRDVASAVDALDKKELLTERIREELFALYDTLPSRDWLEEYRERSVVIGQRIEVLGDLPCSALVLGIDSECRLEIQTDDGEKRILSSGEISTKIIK